MTRVDFNRPAVPADIDAVDKVIEQFPREKGELQKGVLLLIDKIEELQNHLDSNGILKGPIKAQLKRFYNAIQNALILLEELTPALDKSQKFYQMGRIYTGNSALAAKYTVDSRLDDTQKAEWSIHILEHKIYGLKEKLQNSGDGANSENTQKDLAYYEESLNKCKKVVTGNAVYLSPQYRNFADEYITYMHKLSAFLYILELCTGDIPSENEILSTQQIYSGLIPDDSILLLFPAFAIKARIDRANASLQKARRQKEAINNMANKVLSGNIIDAPAMDRFPNKYRPTQKPVSVLDSE